METSRDRGSFPPRRWRRFRIPHHLLARGCVDFADDDFSCVRDGSITELWHWTACGYVDDILETVSASQSCRQDVFEYPRPVIDACQSMTMMHGSGRPGQRQKSDLSRGKPVSV
jgi:hypothetical protein